MLSMIGGGKVGDGPAGTGGKSSSVGEDENPASARRLDRELYALYQKGDYVEALKLAKRSLAIRQRVLGERHEETSVAYYNVAAQLRSLGRFAEAEPFSLRAVEVAENASGKDSDPTAHSLLGLGALYQSTRRFPQAEECLKRMVAIWEKLLGPDDDQTILGRHYLADLYLVKCDFAEETRVRENILATRERKFGPSDARTLDSVSTLALCCGRARDFERAKSLHTRALAGWRALAGGEEDVNVANEYQNLGYLQNEIGKYPEAEELFQKALALRIKILGPNNGVTAMSQGALAQLYSTMGRYDEAEPLFQKACETNLKQVPRDEKELSATTSNFASLYVNKGQYALAESLMREVLGRDEERLGPESVEAGVTRSNLAVLYEAMGDLEKAEREAGNARQILENAVGEDDPRTLTCLSCVAMVQGRLENYDKAEELLGHILSVSRKIFGDTSTESASRLDQLASLYVTRGEYAEAMKLFQQTIAIRQMLFGPDHPETANSLNNLGTLYLSIGSYDKARELFEQSVTSHIRTLGEYHPFVANGEGNLALAYAYLGEFKKAVRAAELDLAITEHIYGPNSVKLVTSLSNFAGRSLQTGDLQKAEALLRRAEEILNRDTAPHLEVLSSVLNNLTVTYCEMGDYRRAKEAGKRAVEYGEKSCPPAEKIPHYNNMGLVELELGNPSEARAFAVRMRQALETSLNNVLSFTSEQERLGFQKRNNAFSLPAMLGDATETARSMLHFKGVVLDSLMEDRLVSERAQSGAQKELVEQWTEARRRLNQLSVVLPRSDSEADLRAHEAELAKQAQTVENWEAKLARHISGLGGARRALSVTPESVQKALANDEVLVEFLRYRHLLGKNDWEDRYGAVVFPPTGALQWIPLGDAEAIDKNIRTYQNQIRAEDSTDEELAGTLHTLTQQIWTPVSTVLPPETRTPILSPDGLLNFVSFATLLVGDQFLAEKYSVRYVSSGRDLLRHVAVTGQRNVAIFANPDFKCDPTGVASRAATRKTVFRSSEQRSVNDLSFGPLKNTAIEADELAKNFRRWGWTVSQPKMGADASKENVMKVQSPYILHLATHGFFQEQSPDEKAANYASGGRLLRTAARTLYFANPMHCSGLALAGAQKAVEALKKGEPYAAEDDGLLTAEDVSTLHLNGTWLVTLSACDTGQGEAQAGEGVFGLRRGFLVAGASNLLMTLWPVSDKETMQMMLHFYEAAHESGNAAQALADTQRTWLVNLRKDAKGGLRNAVVRAGAFIMNSQGHL